MKNIAVVFLILFAISLVVFYSLNFGYIPSNKQEVWGAFGDYIGGLLNPLIAFLVFYYVIKTYESQQKYFKKQELENHFFKLYDEFKNEQKVINESNILEDYNKQISNDRIYNIAKFKEWIYKRKDYPNNFFQLLKFLLTYIYKNKEIKDYSFLIKNKLSNLDLVHLALYDMSKEDEQFTNILKQLNIYEFIDLTDDEIISYIFILNEYDLLKDKLK